MTLFDLYGYFDREGIFWRAGVPGEADDLLRKNHYLGPLRSSNAKLTVIGERDGIPVAVMIWKNPTSRMLPVANWLELSRWCLTPEAGENAGSRMHRWALRLIRELLPETTTLVSYSDPRHGHTGALYRACNWRWAPTWQRLRPPPTGGGDWGTGQQAPKDRWVFCVKPDAGRDAALRISDQGAIRHWQLTASDVERRWAKSSLNLAEVAA